MNCPYCSHRSGIRDVPSKATDEKLADCPDCGRSVYSLDTDNEEQSQIETVREGERKEEWAADLIVEETGLADRHEDNGKVADIDRALYDEGDAEPTAFMEFKSRTCTLNGFAKTMFPYRKIEAAQQLQRERDVTVYVVLKFLDAWTVHIVDADRDYPEADFQFTWKEGADDRTAERQHPTLIPVSDLTRLPFRDDCLDDEQIARQVA